MVRVVFCTLQRQLDAISMYLRLRTTGHRSAVASDTSAPPPAALHDRSTAVDDKHAPAVDAPANAGQDGQNPGQGSAQ